MAFQLPAPDAVGGAAAWEQEWHPYDDYLNIHISRMRRLEGESLVIEDRLSFRPEYSPGTGQALFIRVFGRLNCAHDVSVRVDKILGVRYVRGVLQVRGIDYTYHAWLSSTEQDILRYDTAHGEGLHCHVYDLATGESALLPVPLDMLPTLDGFVRMACRRAAGESLPRT